jgi:hypothetical protein
MEKSIGLMIPAIRLGITIEIIMFLMMTFLSPRYSCISPVTQAAGRLGLMRQPIRPLRIVQQILRSPLTMGQQLLTMPVLTTMVQQLLTMPVLTTMVQQLLGRPITTVQQILTTLTVQQLLGRPITMVQQILTALTVQQLLRTTHRFIHMVLLRQCSFIPQH